MSIQQDVLAEAAGAAHAATALAQRLWRERELLGELHFALAAQNALLSAREVRWLPRADSSVRAALQALHEFELVRAVASDAVAEACGLPGDATLAELIAVIDEPWATILADHRRALLSASVSASRAAQRTRELVRAVRSSGPPVEICEVSA